MSVNVKTFFIDSNSVEVWIGFVNESLNELLGWYTESNFLQSDSQLLLICEILYFFHCPHCRFQLRLLDHCGESIVNQKL